MRQDFLNVYDLTTSNQDEVRMSDLLSTVQTGDPFYTNLLKVISTQRQIIELSVMFNGTRRVLPAGTQLDVQMLHRKGTDVMHYEASENPSDISFHLRSYGRGLTRLDLGDICVFRIGFLIPINAEAGPVNFGLRLMSLEPPVQVIQDYDDNDDPFLIVRRS